MFNHLHNGWTRFIEVCVGGCANLLPNHRRTVRKQIRRCALLSSFPLFVFFLAILLFRPILSSILSHSSISYSYFFASYNFLLCKRTPIFSWFSQKQSTFILEKTFGFSGSGKSDGKLSDSCELVLYSV